MATGRPNLDRGAFAAAIGLEAQTYRRYELAETEPNLDTLRKIREVTGISLDVLIYGEPADVKAPPATQIPIKLQRRA